MYTWLKSAEFLNFKIINWKQMSRQKQDQELTIRREQRMRSRSTETRDHHEKKKPFELNGISSLIASSMTEFKEKKRRRTSQNFTICRIVGIGWLLFNAKRAAVHSMRSIRVDSRHKTINILTMATVTAYILRSSTIYNVL